MKKTQKKKNILVEEPSFSSDTESLTESESDDKEIKESLDLALKAQQNYYELEYWNQRYEKDPADFEWYVSFERLAKPLESILTQVHDVLHIGCGSSTLGYDILQYGVSSVTNVDFSPIIIQRMIDKYSKYDKLKWDVCDITKFPYRKNSFDLVIDKGTIDSLMCSDFAPRLMITTFTEICRVLRPKGYFVCISNGSEPLRRSYFEDHTLNWVVQETITLEKLQIPGTYYYIYITIKK